MVADKIFLNGQVLTMNPKAPFASAFAVMAGRFSVVGSDAAVRKHATAKSDVVDLRGRTVIPGFIETHSHPSLYAMTLLQADCYTPPNRNLEDVKARIKKLADAAAPGRWIKGWGFDDTLITERRHLTQTDLDEAAPRNPVFVSHVSGHLAYSNSMALEIAGIGPETLQPDGGEIHKDDLGNPTGLLKEEAAQRLVVRHIPPYTAAKLKDVLPTAIAYYHQKGITSTHDAAIGYFRNGPQIFQAYRELESEGKLELRIYMTAVEELYREIVKSGLGTGFGSNRLRLGGVKFFQDGSIQANTAALIEAYHNKPDFSGELILSQDTLDNLFEKYHEMGLQIAVHANGDRAIGSVLQALEKANQRHPRKDHRHMIIHCQLASKEHIARMKRLNVIPSYFVNHVYYWGDRHASIFLGPERAQRIDPLAASVQEGLAFTLHSDLPVTPVDPLFSMHCAVNRTTKGGKVLGPHERISPLEALKAYTTHAAYCSFEENTKGSIETGKLADFTLLSGNPLDVSPEKIKDIQVMQTSVGGRTVYERG